MLQFTGFESFDLNVNSLLDLLYVEGIQLPRQFAISYRKWKSGPLSLQSDFCPRFGGLFHRGHISPTTAMMLYQAGFTNVDSELEGITPLLNVEPPRNRFELLHYFRIVEFFVDKGSRLDRQIPSSYISNPPPNNNASNSYRVIRRIASSSCGGVSVFGPGDVSAAI
jgi:hypothetical protein